MAALSLVLLSGHCTCDGHCTSSWWVIWWILIGKPSPLNCDCRRGFWKWPWRFRDRHKNAHNLIIIAHIWYLIGRRVIIQYRLCMYVFTSWCQLNSKKSRFLSCHTVIGSECIGALCAFCRCLKVWWSWKLTVIWPIYCHFSCCAHLDEQIWICMNIYGVELVFDHILAV